MKFNIPKECSHKGGVYIIRSTITNDAYIGATNDFQLRYYQHKTLSSNGYQYQRKLYDFIHKNASCLSFEMLKECELLIERKNLENEFILQLSPTLNSKSGCAPSFRYDKLNPGEFINVPNGKKKVSIINAARNYGRKNNRTFAQRTDEHGNTKLFRTT